MRNILWTVLLGAMVMGVYGCESESKNAKVQIWLTDAPGDYEEVNVEITGVEVHTEGGEQSSGWTELDIEDGVYNLLELTNGLDTLLGTIELPAGRISQVRLKLGDDNSIKVGGEVHPLKTPSAQQSGLKLQVQKALSEGITYKILLDFDVARSIVVTGGSTYVLKPLIRTITEAQDGVIKGFIHPVEATPAVYAVLAGDTVGTTFAGADGKFLIRGLPTGIYTVALVPHTGFQAIHEENVSVTVGSVTDIGAVDFAE